MPYPWDVFGQGNGPMSQVMPPFYTGPMNVGGMLGGGMTGLAGQLYLNSMLGGLMGSSGMMPAQFLPMQGFYDQMRGRRYFEQTQQALRGVSDLEGQMWSQSLMGMSRTFGLGMSQSAANTMGRDIGSMVSPMMAQMMPELYDKLGGTRGSAAVLSLGLMRGGQMMRDPLSRGIGFSGDTSALMAREIYQTTYGSDESIRRMQGVRAGEAGMLYEELVRRGMGAGGIGQMTGQEQMRSLAGMNMDDAMVGRISDRTGRSAADIRNTQAELRRRAAGGSGDFGGLDTPVVDDLRRSFDAKEIGKRLEGMAGVVSAMKDIFGDAGHPNAPMRELVMGLEALTQGGLATMAPGRLNQIVRQTYNLSRMSGMSLETVMGLSAQNAGAADMLGLPREAAPLGTMGAMAFNTAIRNAGFMNNPAFNAKGIDQLTLLSSRLGMQAMASPVVNTASAVMRLVDEGLITNPNSKAMALYNALKAGQSTFAFGGQNINIPNLLNNFGAMTNLLAGSGIERSTAVSALGATAANQEYGAKYDLGNTIGRPAQLQLDILPQFGRSYSPFLNAEMPGAGKAKQAQVREAIMAGIAAMDDPTRSDPGKRMAHMQQVIKQAFGAAGINISNERARAIQESGWGAAENIFRYSRRYSGYAGAINVLRVHDPRLAANIVAARADAATEAEMQTSLGDLAKDGPISRIMDVIRNTANDPNMTIEKMMSTALGGVEIQDVAKRMGGPGQEFVQALWDFQRAARDPKTGNLTKAGQAQRNAAAKKVSEMVNKHGIYEQLLGAGPYKQAMEDIKARNEFGALTPQQQQAAVMGKLLDKLPEDARTHLTGAQRDSLMRGIGDRGIEMQLFEAERDGSLGTKLQGMDTSTPEKLLAAIRQAFPAAAGSVDDKNKPQKVLVEGGELKATLDLSNWKEAILSLFFGDNKGPKPPPAAGT